MPTSFAVLWTSCSTRAGGRWNKKGCSAQLSCMQIVTWDLVRLPLPATQRRQVGFDLGELRGENCSSNGITSLLAMHQTIVFMWIWPPQPCPASLMSFDNQVPGDAMWVVMDAELATSPWGWEEFLLKGCSWQAGHWRFRFLHRIHVWYIPSLCPCVYLYRPPPIYVLWICAWPLSGVQSPAW